MTSGGTVKARTALFVYNALTFPPSFRQTGYILKAPRLKKPLL
jgi:hypothetical protein